MTTEWKRDERPTSSPWGRPDETEELAPGIWRVDTPSHGGIRVSRQRKAAMPEYIRAQADGNWFEEDCAWCLVALCFPEAFPQTYAGGNVLTAAMDTCINWYPDEYEKFTGDFIPVEKSYKLRERKFKADSAGKLVVTAGFGSWAHFVPKGKVGVCATIDGVRGSPERWFLVDDAEYTIPFVVDPTRHTEIPKPDLAQTYARS